MSCNIWNKCTKFKKLKYHTFKKKNNLSIVYSKCCHEYEKTFKEKSTEILKILGLINNIEENQKIHNHAWRKYKSRI